MVEIPVHPESAPFLVSGTLGKWVWISESKKGVLRAAFRDGSVPEDLNLSIAKVVAQESALRKWGNISSFNAKGILAAVEYLRFYGFGADVEVLVPVGCRLKAPKGVSFVEAPWLPAKKAVAVPADRSFLGILGAIGGERYAVVVHNPSRGMALIGGW